MYQLIYASAAAASFSNEQLLGLLEVSRRNNQKRGLTGLLLYRTGQFLQVLEGQREVVLELYTKILLDPRHRHGRVISEGERPDRDFPDWSMGFRNLLLGDESPPGFSQLLNEPNQERDRATARLLLSAFRRPSCQSSPT